MKKLITLTLALGTVTVVMLAAAGFGNCGQPLGPPRGPMGPMAPMGPMQPNVGPMQPNMGHVPPHAAFGPGLQPCFPGPCLLPEPCRIFSFEGGGRGFYTGNSFRVTYSNRADIDFIRDLHFAQNTLVAEVYAAVRMVPTMALTYSYMIPRDDNGHGTLPEDLTIGNTVFLAGTAVNLKSTTSRHRLEGEYFAVLGDRFRAGALLMGELWVENLQMQSATNRDSQQFEEFLMGAGVTGEFAPANGIFMKGKGAYTFLQKQNGLYLDFQGKFFPEFIGCGGQQMQMRPYVTAGYRFRTSEWVINDDRKIQASIQGPYIELGVIF